MRISQLPLTIPQFSILVLILFLGMLIGIYIALSLLKAGRVKRRSKKMKTVIVGDDTVEEPPSEHHLTMPPEELVPDVQSALMKPKYTEGSILEEKLKREGVSMFDLNCAADGDDPGDRVKLRQSGEDDAYSILKK